MDKNSFFGHSYFLLAGVVFAVLLRIYWQPPTSPIMTRNIINIIISFVAGVLIGLNFYSVVVEFHGLDPEFWNTPMAIVLALTGENIVKMFLQLTSDFTKIKEILQIFRGGSHK